MGSKLLNALYIHLHVVRPFVCANCVREYMIERAYARAYIYICACTCIHVTLRTCLCADLIKTQNAFAHNISTLKRTLGSETFRMYYILFLKPCLLCSSYSRSTSVSLVMSDFAPPINYRNWKDKREQGGGRF